MKANYIEIESRREVDQLIEQGGVVRHYAFQGVVFTPSDAVCSFTDCIFMGCILPDEVRYVLAEDCLIFPSIPKTFKVFPSDLYRPEQLYEGYQVGNARSFEECYDTRVYRHYMANGKQTVDISESLARTLHDHSINDALQDMLANYSERHIVAMMGGHALQRTDAGYHAVARMAKHLTEAGLLMLSGGGPGAMEATHLGAWMAGRSDEELAEAVALLAVAPTYKDEGWLDSAFEVRERWPQKSGYCSIGIPTWFYGHEPATPFATHIAKLFENSVREDGLLALAKGGVIYTPGSAGTMQEIFQDAAQNHYETFGYSSPMLFYGVEYWRKTQPVYSLLEHLVANGRYRNLMIGLSDSEQEIEREVLRFALQEAGAE